jgi:hypothetical protein
MSQPTHLNARLPLIDEFDGFCRAVGEPLPVPSASRLRLCNHGNARGQCGHFPSQDPRGCVRFEVLRRSAAHLDLLLVEEAGHAPLAWNRLTFLIASEALEPEPIDTCRRAQLLAFCRSFLHRYPG